MNRKDDYIAVFDSGVGGISVLKALQRLMPEERYLYFGDSANAPYGSRSTQEVRSLTLAAAEKLVRRGIKALVVACNTATAAAITDLRHKYDDLIVIGIEPALKLAADHFSGGRIGVMATEVTLREEKFEELLHRFEDHCYVFKIPAPGLVELVEQGKVNDADTRALLTRHLGAFAGKLDCLVLGCTHYPFAQSAIRAVLGADTVLLHGGEGTARETKRRLAEAGLLRRGEGQILFENSSGDEAMIALCRRLLQSGE